MLGFDHPWLFGVSIGLAALVAAGFVILAQQGPRPGDVWAEPSRWDTPGALGLALALLAWQAGLLGSLPAKRVGVAALAVVGLSLLALRQQRSSGPANTLAAAALLLAASWVLPVADDRLRIDALPDLAAMLLAGAALGAATLGMQALRIGARWRRAGHAAAFLLLLAALLAGESLWQPSASAAVAQAAALPLELALPPALLALLLIGGRRRDAVHGHLRELRLSGLKQRQLLLAGDAERLLRENANCARQAEARLELLLGSAGIGAFDWDLINGTVRYSERWATMLGYEPHRIEPHRDSWLRLVHPADLDRMQRDLAAHLSGDRARLVCELRMRNAAQVWQWVLVQGQVVDRSAEGRPRRLIGTQTDIDDAKRERLAREVEQRLFGGGPVQRVVLEAVPPYRLRDGAGALPPGVDDAPPAGIAFAERVHGDDLATLGAAASAARSQPEQPLHCELRLAQADGAWRWVLLRALLDDSSADDAPLLRGVLVDIDDLKQAQAAMSRQGEDLRALVARMAATQRLLEGVQELTEQLQVCDSAEDGRALIARAGQALFPGWDGGLAFVGNDGLLALDTRWGGFAPPAGRLGGADCWALKLGRVHHVQRARRDAQGESAALLPVCGHFGGGRQLPDGVQHTLCVPLASEPGHAPSGALQLLTRQPLAEDELRIVLWGAQSFAHALRLSLANLALRLSLRDQAVRDWLTGLYNRRHFDEVLHQELGRAARNDDNLVLAVIDVDHFKAFNDTFGHEAGDAVLRAVAEELHGFVRAYDTAARIGGEELAVLLPRAHLEETCARLDQLRTRVAALALAYDGPTLPGITVSIGVADIAHGPAHNLLQRADQAMYISKHEGRDRLTCWSESLPSVSELALLDEAAAEARRTQPAAAL